MEIDARETPVSQRRPGRIAMILAGTAFAAFLVNAVAGKVSLLLGMYPPLHLGNIPEVLLLLAAVVCFVAGVLEKERAQSPQSRGGEEP